MITLKKIAKFLYNRKHFVISFLILFFLYKFYLNIEFNIVNFFKNNILYFLFFGILFELSLILPILKNHYLFKYSNLNISKYVPFRLIYFSYLGDNIAMNIGGDVTKFSIYKKFFSTRKTIFFLFFDKLSVLGAKFIILYFLILIFLYKNFENHLVNFIIISFFLVVMSYLIISFSINSLINLKLNFFKFKSKYLLTFKKIIKEDKNLRKIFFVYILFSLIHQIYLCFIFYLLCLHLNISISFEESSIIFLLLIILSRIPLSFSGFGVREFFSIIFFSAIGITSELAFSASVYYGLIALFPMISSTFLYFYYKKII